MPWQPNYIRKIALATYWFVHSGTLHVFVLICSRSITNTNSSESGPTLGHSFEQLYLSIPCTLSTGLWIQKRGHSGCWYFLDHSQIYPISGRRRWKVLSESLWFYWIIQCQELLFSGKTRALWIVSCLTSSLHFCFWGQQLHCGDRCQVHPGYD